MIVITERQTRFVDAYIKIGNASEAARLAGYAEKNANVDSSKLLANPNISAEVKRRLAELKTERTADLPETLELVTSVLRGEKKDVLAMNVGTGKGFTKIELVEVPASTRDMLKAAEFLLKINGAFKNEVKITGNIPVVISGGNELED